MGARAHGKMRTTERDEILKHNDIRQQAMANTTHDTRTKRNQSILLHGIPRMLSEFGIFVALRFRDDIFRVCVDSSRGAHFSFVRSHQISRADPTHTRFVV